MLIVRKMEFSALQDQNFVSQVPTNSGVDLQAVKDGIEEIKTDVMEWDKDEKINITPAKNKVQISEFTIPFG